MRHPGTLFVRKYFRSLLLVIIVLAATFGAAAAAHYNQINSPLFQDASLYEPQGVFQELAVVRQRYVTVDPYPLEWASPGSQVELNLFEDVILYAVIDSVSKQGESMVWMGHVADIPLSMVAFTGSQGQFAGDIVMPEAIYQVRYAVGDGAGNHVHVIYQIDQSQYPEEAPPIEVNLPGGPQPFGGRSRPPQHSVGASGRNEWCPGFEAPQHGAHGGEAGIRTPDTGFASVTA